MQASDPARLQRLAVDRLESERPPTRVERQRPRHPEPRGGGGCGRNGGVNGLSARALLAAVDLDVRPGRSGFILARAQSPPSRGRRRQAAARTDRRPAGPDRRWAPRRERASGSAGRSGTSRTRSRAHVRGRPGAAAREGSKRAGERALEVAGSAARLERAGRDEMVGSGDADAEQQPEPPPDAVLRAYPLEPLDPERAAQAEQRVEARREPRRVEQDVASRDAYVRGEGRRVAHASSIPLRRHRAGVHRRARRSHRSHRRCCLRLRRGSRLRRGRPRGPAARVAQRPAPVARRRR